MSSALNSSKDADFASCEPGRKLLSLTIPEPSARPGQTPNFDKLGLTQSECPNLLPNDVPARETHGHAYGLIQVLNKDAEATGPWAPTIAPDVLRAGLRAMLMTRIYDEHMFKAQRQGKTSFYMKSRGEEAVGVAQAYALSPTDMCFPTYRLQSLLIARGYPLLQMMGQIYSSALDPLKGRQMPVLYSSREFNYFSQSANLGTQYPHAVGWAMGSALSGDHRIASAWIGDGATAEGDFHYALTFASVYKAPVILNIVNNQWAISSFQGIAGGIAAPFAARGIGYGLPTLRVDGNDFLAVYAVTHWAANRARSNHGATVIELVTYRAEGHSTSDDPTRYRPVDEPAGWPLGDPIERLKIHLIKRGEWSEDNQRALQEELTALIRQTQREAEAVGTLMSGTKSDPRTLFDDVYKSADRRLTQQRERAGL